MENLLPPLLIVFLRLSAEGPEDPLAAQPQTFADSVTVTAARTAARMGETPASVEVLTSRDVELASTTAIDAVLRQVPGFTLFGGRTAAPRTRRRRARRFGASAEAGPRARWFSTMASR